VRRQDQVLRVIDDEPRLFGLRFRSCINLFVIVSFTWGLYLVVVYGLDIGGGLHGNSLLVSLWAGAFAVIRWVEKREDVDFLGAALRYVLSGRSRVLYSGAGAARFEPHPFEDLLLLSRVLRVRAASTRTP
jgi:hypothetical protein